MYPKKRGNYYILKAPSCLEFYLVFGGRKCTYSELGFPNLRKV